MTADEASKYVVVWQTLVATLIALLISALAGFVAGLAIVLYESFLTTDSAPIVMLTTGLISGLTGVGAARLTCDKLFLHYSKQFIFLAFVAASIATIWYHTLRGPHDWSQFETYVESVTTIGAAFVFFWRNKPL